MDLGKKMEMGGCIGTKQMDEPKEQIVYPGLYVSDIKIEDAEIGKEYTFKGILTGLNERTIHKKDGEDAGTTCSYDFEIQSIEGVESPKEEEESEEETIDQAADKAMKKMKGKTDESKKY